MTSIHPTAVLSEGATLADGVEVGPYCVIGPNVTIGEATKLMAHVVLDGVTTVGRSCHLFPFSCVGTESQDLKFSGARTSVEIGDETTLREYVTVNSGTNEGEVTKVGKGCHIMAYSHIAHACSVGNGVIMANCATLAGDVVIEDQAIIGGLSGVHQFSHIGRLCMVGGCTKVVKDCPPFMIVDGNPATVRGLNLLGLQRKNVKQQVVDQLREAYRLLYRKGLSTSQAVKAIRGELEPCAEVNHLLEFVEKSERGIVK